MWGYCTVMNACQMPEVSVQVAKFKYRLCPRAGRWTLGMVEGPCRRRGWRSLRFATCDSRRTQTVRTLSHSCRDIPKMLETCDEINEILDKCLVCSRHERHVRDFDNLPLLNALLVLLAGDYFVLAGDPKRVE